MSILKAIFKEAILFGNYRHFRVEVIFRANEHANLLGGSPKNRAGGKIRVVITRVLQWSPVEIMRFTRGSPLGGNAAFAASVATTLFRTARTPYRQAVWEKAIWKCNKMHLYNRLPLLWS